MPDASGGSDDHGCVAAVEEDPCLLGISSGAGSGGKDPRCSSSFSSGPLSGQVPLSRVGFSHGERVSCWVGDSESSRRPTRAGVSGDPGGAVASGGSGGALSHDRSVLGSHQDVFLSSDGEVEFAPPCRLARDVVSGYEDLVQDSSGSLALLACDDGRKCSTGASGYPPDSWNSSVG